MPTEEETMSLPAEVVQLMKDVQILKDIEAIKRIKHAYFRCIDTANIKELAEIMDENVTAVLVGGTYAITLQGRDQYLEMVANSFHSEFVGEHNGHHPEIDILSDTEAQGTWYLTDVAMNLRDKITTIGSAIYRDKYVKVGGKWKIKHTAYERIYEMIQDVPVRPNLTVHYLAKHGVKAPTYNVTEQYAKSAE
jgi:hypothetical protein